MPATAGRSYISTVKPLPFVWPYALVYWAIYAITFYPEWKIVQTARVNARRPESKDRGSIGVLLTVTWIALFVAYPVAFYKPAMVSPSLLVPFFWLGLVLIASGSLLRRICWRTLGQYFTGDVQARADQPVICSGPYRLVRHPSYTGGMMTFIGIGFALGNWISLILLVIATIVAYGYRVNVEEKVLVETIGAPYRDYMNRTKRFVPFVF